MSIACDELLGRRLSPIVECTPRRNDDGCKFAPVIDDESTCNLLEGSTKAVTGHLTNGRRNFQ